MTELLAFTPRTMRGVRERREWMLVAWRTWVHALALRAFVREAPPSVGRSRAHEQLFPQTDFSSHQENTFQCAQRLGWEATRAGVSKTLVGGAKAQGQLDHLRQVLQPSPHPHRRHPGRGAAGGLRGNPAMHLA